MTGRHSAPDSRRPGDRLVRLERAPSGWDVVTADASGERVASAADVEDAYAAALLPLLPLLP